MAVTDAENQWIAADQPISKRQDDRLSRADFSRELARAIAGWTGNTSLTIALYGAWGSGKSSVKNMAVEYLTELQAPRPTVIEFNPWRLSNADELAAAFFREVGKGLGKNDDTAKAKRVSKLWRKYSAAFSLTAAIVGAVPKLIGAILIAVGMLSLFGYLLAIPETARAIGGLLTSAAPLIAGLLLRTGAFSEKVAKYFEAKAAVSELSLEERRSELEDELKKRTSPVVVIVDDIDRLSADRIAPMFQLVKAMGDLPKFVYLLPFQRSTVEMCLNNIANNEGAKYLEKIVQVGLDLPHVSQTEVEKILFDGLNGIMAETKNPTFDQTRWGNIYVGGLNSYFRTIRDVKRYLASLQFHIPLFFDGKSLEVNIVDLFTVEAIRVFEPELYGRFRTSKSLLTTGPHRAKSDERRKAELQAIVNSASDGRTSQLQQILTRLFPQTAWAFGGMERSGEAHERWVMELRMCSPDVYDKYLHFSVSPNDISQTELDWLVSLTGDRQNFLNALRSFHSRGLISTALDRLDVRRDQIARQSAVPFLAALFDLGDHLDDRESPGVMVGPERYLGRLIRRFSRTISDEKERVEILAQAIREAKGLDQPCALAYRETNKERRAELGGETLVSEAAAQNLVPLCLRKIQDAAKDGELHKNLHLAHLLYRWIDWQGTEAPREWVANLCASPDGAMAFLDALTHRGFASNMDDPVGRVTTSVSVSELQRFVDIDLLEKQIKQLQLSGRTEDERVVVHVFEKALKRLRAGKPESSFLDDDDD